MFEAPLPAPIFYSQKIPLRAGSRYYTRAPETLDLFRQQKKNHVIQPSIRPIKNIPRKYIYITGMFYQPLLSKKNSRNFFCISPPIRSHSSTPLQRRKVYAPKPQNQPPHGKIFFSVKNVFCFLLHVNTPA